jgi:hypothetical protein
VFLYGVMVEKLVNDRSSLLVNVASVDGTINKGRGFASLKCE